jgi:hypothetical protein
MGSIRASHVPSTLMNVPTAGSSRAG